MFRRPVFHVLETCRSDVVLMGKIWSRVETPTVESSRLSDYIIASGEVHVGCFSVVGGDDDDATTSSRHGRGSCVFSGRGGVAFMT